MHEKVKYFVLIPILGNKLSKHSFWYLGWKVSNIYVPGKPVLLLTGYHADVIDDVAYKSAIFADMTSDMDLNVNNINKTYFYIIILFSIK